MLSKTNVFYVFISLALGMPAKPPFQFPTLGYAFKTNAFKLSYLLL
jgi:hypothetical protein